MIGSVHGNAGRYLSRVHASTENKRARTVYRNTAIYHNVHADVAKGLRFIRISRADGISRCRTIKRIGVEVCSCTGSTVRTTTLSVGQTRLHPAAADLQAMAAGKCGLCSNSLEREQSSPKKEHSQKKCGDHGESRGEECISPVRFFFILVVPARASSRVGHQPRAFRHGLTRLPPNYTIRRDLKDPEGSATEQSNPVARRLGERRVQVRLSAGR